VGGRGLARTGPVRVRGILIPVSVSSILPAVVMGVAFVVAVRSLPVLHPIQIWAGSWAVATVLYALRLLPYRDLSWLTAGLICGGVAMFALGAPLGARIARRRRPS